MTNEEKVKAYPKTDLFEVVDTIGVPHPFCITHHHVAMASDKHFGRLGREAIEDYERLKGKPSCGVKGCTLKFAEHEQALLVKVKVDDKEQLRAYCLSIVDQCQRDGFAGFAFLDGTGEKQ